MKGFLLRTAISILLFGACFWVLYQQINEHKDSLWLLRHEAMGLWLPFCSTAVLFAIAIFIRAHRWGLCLGRTDLLALSFRSIAIGYLVQCPLSKLGEVVRMTNQKKNSDLRLGEIVSTVTIDRLLDVFSLLILLLVSTYIGGGLIQENFPEFESLLPKVTLMFLVLSLGLVAVFIFHSKVKSLLSAIPLIPEMIKSAFISFLEHFNLGLRNCRSVSMVAYLFASTVLIWALYILVFYIVITPWSALSELTLGDTFILFLISALGILVPVPGGLAYPLFLNQGIRIVVPEIDHGTALSISLFCYFINFWFVNLVNGGITWIWQLSSSKKIVLTAHE